MAVNKTKLHAMMIPPKSSHESHKIIRFFQCQTVAKRFCKKAPPKPSQFFSKRSCCLQSLVHSTVKKSKSIKKRVSNGMKRSIDVQYCMQQQCYREKESQLLQLKTFALQYEVPIRHTRARTHAHAPPHKERGVCL